MAMINGDDRVIEETLFWLVSRVFGVASLLALPGIWWALRDADAQTQMMGLGVSISLIGISGLCLMRKG